MSLGLVELHDAITAKVKAVLPNTPIEEDSLPDELVLNLDANNQLVPYVILRFSPLRAATNRGSMGGVRLDDYYGTMDIMTCAPVGRMSRQMLDILTDALMGFDPGSGGQMRLEGGASQFVVSSNEARPTQFVCTVRMRFNANGRNVGVPLTP